MAELGKMGRYMADSESAKLKIIEIPASYSARQEDQQNRKLRVCAYCRVSSDSEDQIHSFNAQYEYYDQYIKNNEEWIFAGIYADEGITGTSKTKREHFLEMLEDCEAGKVDLIITKSISRFARNVIDCIATVRYLRTKGIGVLFEKERVNTLIMENERFLTICGSVAQEEAMSTSKNVHWACVRRFENGTFVISRVPYGYKKDEQKELIPYKPEARVIRMSADWYLNGEGFDTIAKRLTQMEIPAPRGGIWYASTVRRILTNEKTVGDYLMQKRITNGIVPFKQLSNKGQSRQYFIKDDHEGILSREERSKMELIMNTRRPIRKERNLEESIQKEQLICGICGSKLFREYAPSIKEENKTIWRCKKQHRDHHACNLKMVKDADIKSAVEILVKKLQQAQEQILDPLLRQLNDLKAKNRSGSLLQQIEGSLSEAKMERHVLQRMRAEGYIVPSIFIAQNQVLDQKQKELRKRREELLSRSSLRKQAEDLQTLIAFLNLKDSLEVSVAEELIRDLIDQIEVLNERCFLIDMRCGLKLSMDLNREIDGDTISDSFGLQIM